MWNLQQQMEHNILYKQIKIISDNSCNSSGLQTSWNSIKNHLSSISKNHLVNKLLVTDHEHVRTSKLLVYLFSNVTWLEMTSKNQHKSIHISFQEVSVSFNFIFSSHAKSVSSSSDTISPFSITIITHLQNFVLSEEQTSMVPDTYKQIKKFLP